MSGRGYVMAWPVAPIFHSGRNFYAGRIQPMKPIWEFVAPARSKAARILKRKYRSKLTRNPPYFVLRSPKATAFWQLYQTHCPPGLFGLAWRKEVVAG